jgi:hypothetical protein
MEHSSQMAERERREAAIAEKKKEELRLMLKRQIDENELRKKLSTNDKYSEGLEFQKKMVCKRPNVRIFLSFETASHQKEMCVILMHHVLLHLLLLQAADRKKFESIRDQMVNDMRSEGLKEIYFAEMLHLDFDKMLTV